MGQKSNTLTLRKDITRLESYASNSKSFLNANDYVNTLKRSLEKKNVIVVSHSFDATTDTFDLSLNLFFKTRKVQRYLKKKFKTKLKGKKLWIRKSSYRRTHIVKMRELSRKSEELKLKDEVDRSKERANKWKARLKSKSKSKKINKKKRSLLITKKKGWTKALSTLTKSLPSNNLIIHKITVLNKQINMKIVQIVHSKLKFFKKMLFSRRFDLYYDFLKLTSLLITRKVKIGVYNVILGKIFKYLMKKSHNKFFNFLKKLSHLVTKSSTIGGIKFGINGKLKGKLRAKSFKLEIGKIGIQTITSDIDFSKVHINTLYGCFGLKTWIKYK